MKRKQTIRRKFSVSYLFSVRVVKKLRLNVSKTLYLLAKLILQEGVSNKKKFETPPKIKTNVRLILKSKQFGDSPLIKTNMRRFPTNTVLYYKV